MLNFVKKRHVQIGLGACIFITGFIVACGQDRAPKHDQSAFAVYQDVLQAMQTHSQEIGNPLNIVEGKLRQSVGTPLEFYVKIAPASHLYVELLPGHEKLIGSVEVSADDIPHQTFEFIEKGEHQIDLSGFADQIVQLRFTVKGEASKDASADWATIRLQTPIGANATAPSAATTPVAGSNLNQYNVVYLILDAFHADHASLYGYDKPTTPFLEEFAKDALVFDHMYANAPYTLASTGTLFTSKYSHEHGLIHEKTSLNPLVPTLGELLTEAGIHTSMITRHGYLVGAWGLLRGFAQLWKGDYGNQPENAFREIQRIFEDYAQSRKFIYIHLGPPHSPYQPPAAFQKFVTPLTSDVIEPINDNLHKIDDGKIKPTPEQLEHIISWYDSNVLYADYLAQQLIASLKEQGLLEKTIVIISSDHGEGLLEHGRMLHGSTVFDEMIHIPLLVRFPKDVGVTPRRIPYLASTIDMTATLAEIFGIPPADFAGTSLLPEIFQDQPVRQFIYTETLADRGGMRGIRDLRYKYIHTAKKHLLFDLLTDPQEQHNLAQERRITVDYYAQLMEPFLHREQAAMAPAINMDTQSEEVRQNLKDLGYIK